MIITNWKRQWHTVRWRARGRQVLLFVCLLCVSLPCRGRVRCIRPAWCASVGAEIVAVGARYVSAPVAIRPVPDRRNCCHRLAAAVLMTTRDCVQVNPTTGQSYWHLRHCDRANQWQRQQRSGRRSVYGPCDAMFSQCTAQLATAERGTPGTNDDCIVVVVVVQL